MGKAATEAVGIQCAGTCYHVGENFALSRPLSVFTLMTTRQEPALGRASRTLNFSVAYA